MEYVSSTLGKQASRFGEIRTPVQAAVLLHTEPHHISLQALHPSYRIYEIPKKDGGRRLIEDPHVPLKKLQRSLNHYLQACYHTLRPACVHGFCISARHEPRRNIVSNARMHCGRRYMLNLDLENFFHAITSARIERIWKQYFPRFNNPLATLLTGLVTFRGRLPMGAPSSPVLSNFACLALDHEMLGYCGAASITYSRFADDLTFSSQKPITAADQQFFRGVVKHHGFAVKESKWKLYGPSDVKIVTGLIVEAGGVTLDSRYLKQLAEEIGRMRHTLLVEQRYQTGMSHRKLALLRQELSGKISFASMVLGPNHRQVTGLQQAYEEALHPPPEFESSGWLDVPYEFFSER